MISIKRFLSQAKDERFKTWQLLARSVIQSIGEYAVRGDQVEYETFQKDMRKLADTVGEQLSAEDILILTGAVCKSLQNHGEQTNRFIRAESLELQTMLQLVTETVISVSNASQRTVNRLRDLEKQLGKATVIEDIRSLKERLNVCLEALRAEATAQEEEGASTAESLQHQVQESGRRIRELTIGQMIDPVTGLPGPAAAEDALRTGIRTPSGLFVAVFVLQRLPLITTRFGQAVGDQLLITFAESLGKQIAATDRLYRWSGPSFLVLMERTEQLEQLQQELRRITRQRLEQTIEVGSRTVLLPIFCSFAVFPVSRWKGLEVLLSKMHDFVASQLGVRPANSEAAQ